MSNFNTPNDQQENKFAKNNASLLTNFFGTADLTSFWIADMDFKIAEPITEELQRMINRGIYSYEFAPVTVFKSISQWFFRRHQLSLKPSCFLQVPSVLTGIAVLIKNFSAPQDGVLIQTPVYHQFTTIIKNVNRQIIENPLKNTNGRYAMDYEDLELKFKSGKVKVMILCNPHNPVGRVWKKEELLRVLELANQYQVKIISDEIHADIVYKNHTFCSLMSLKAENHFALIGSPAKTFGMHSISNGYIYIPNKENLKKVKSEVSGMFLDHGSIFNTFAAIAAYNHGQPWAEDLIAYLDKTIDWIKHFLATELPAVKLSPVEGTYQIWLDFSNLGLTADELKSKIINDAKLGLAHGDWFDKSGAHDQFMRINIASPLSKIQAAFNNLKEALVKN